MVSLLVSSRTCKECPKTSPGFDHTTRDRSPWAHLELPGLLIAHGNGKKSSLISACDSGTEHR